MSFRVPGALRKLRTTTATTAAKLATTASRATGRGAGGQGAQVPRGDEVQAGAEQDEDQRVHQPARDEQHHALPGHLDGHHHGDEEEGEHRTRRGGHAELVDQQAVDGVGDAHAVDQHDRVDGAEDDEE